MAGQGSAGLDEERTLVRVLVDGAAVGTLPAGRLELEELLDPGLEPTGRDQVHQRETASDGLLETPPQSAQLLAALARQLLLGVVVDAMTLG